MFSVNFFLVLLLALSPITSAIPARQSWYDFESNYVESKPAAEKFNLIWNMMKSNGAENPPYDSIINFLKNLNLLPFIPGMRLPLITSTSMFRPWRLEQKPLHTRPAYASVRMTFNEEAHSHYNGLFAADSVEHGLMSFSPGFRVPNITNFFAFSLRLFRDEVPAASMIAAFNVISHANWNVFDYMVCTHYNWLMALPLLLLAPMKSGEGWTRIYNQFGLSNLAQYTVAGEAETDPRFPWGLCMIPSDAVRQKLAGTKASNEAIELLSKIEPGDVLYDIWAIKEPYPLAVPALLPQYTHHIGQLEATSAFFTSTYGAMRLLGTHQRFEQDLEYRPDWKAYTTPLFLSRAGAVGSYSALFRKPDPDIVAAQQNLMLAMTGVWKAFSTKPGFHAFMRRLGVFPDQLYDNFVNYIINDLLPARTSSYSRSIAPWIKRSPQWVINTIHNVAGYITAVGSHPPLLPLQLGHLGRRAAEGLEKIKALVEQASDGPICHAPLACEEEVCDAICANENDTRTTLVEKLHVGNTLFANVRALPFHIDVFSVVI